MAPSGKKEMGKKEMGKKETGNTADLNGLGQPEGRRLRNQSRGKNTDSTYAAIAINEGNLAQTSNAKERRGRSQPVTRGTIQTQTHGEAGGPGDERKNRQSIHTGVKKSFKELVDAEDDSLGEERDHTFLTTSSEEWQIPDSEFSMLPPSQIQPIGSPKKRGVPSVSQPKQDETIDMKFLESCSPCVKLRSLQQASQMGKVSEPVMELYNSFEQAPDGCIPYSLWVCALQCSSF